MPYLFRVCRVVRRFRSHHFIHPQSKVANDGKSDGRGLERHTFT